MQSKSDDPDSLLDGITDRMKSSLNSIFHLMLNSLTFPTWQVVVILTLEFIQSLYFLFYEPAAFEWNFPDAESAMEFLIKISLIWPYLAEKSVAIYFAFFYLSGFLLSLCLCLLIAFALIKGKKKSLIRLTLLHLLGIFIHLLQSLLFMPLLSIFFAFNSLKSNVCINFKLFLWKKYYPY